ncbi:MAG: hypothetical protein RLZZ29_604 [Cyanobacteriota bacterium]|jgi:hypothetical protein
MRKVKGIFDIFLSGLITMIAINYLVLGTIDYFRSVDDLVNWLQNKPQQERKVEEK